MEFGFTEHNSTKEKNFISMNQRSSLFMVEKNVYHGNSASRRDEA